MGARFKLKAKGVGQLLRSAPVREEMVRRAELVMAAAVSASPVGGAGDPHPGLYRDSWHVTSSGRGGRRRDRATATVYNTAPHAAIVEFGGGHVAARHVLLHAARAGGG